MCWCLLNSLLDQKSNSLTLEVRSTKTMPILILWKDVHNTTSYSHNLIWTTVFVDYTWCEDYIFAFIALENGYFRLDLSLCRYYTHDNDYLEICRCYKAIYDIPSVKENPVQWIPVKLFYILSLS